MVRSPVILGRGCRLYLRPDAHMLWESPLLPTASEDAGVSLPECLRSGGPSRAPLPSPSSRLPAPCPLRAAVEQREEEPAPPLRVVHMVSASSALGDTRQRVSGFPFTPAGLRRTVLCEQPSPVAAASENVNKEWRGWEGLKLRQLRRPAVAAAEA